MLLVDMQKLSKSRDSSERSAIAELFQEAELSDAVLFFDECEANYYHLSPHIRAHVRYYAHPRARVMSFSSSLCRGQNQTDRENHLMLRET